MRPTPTTPPQSPRPLSFRLPSPARVRDRDGVERLVGRRPIVHVGGHVYCPDLHRLRGVSTLLEEDTLRCEHTDPRTRQQCGILVFCIAHFTARDGTPLLWGVEVTPGEVQRMRRMTIGQRLEYIEMTSFGAPHPPREEGSCASA